MIQSSPTGQNTLEHVPLISSNATLARSALSPVIKLPPNVYKTAVDTASVKYVPFLRFRFGFATVRLVTWTLASV